MKEKIWVDCPACGSSGTMVYKKNISETFRHTDYKPVTISGLDGYFCSVCGDGIYSSKSRNRIDCLLADEKARQDSTRTLASELTMVDTIAKKLSVSRQRVHQMMDEGKLSYVYIENMRIPRKLSKTVINTYRKKASRRSGVSGPHKDGNRKAFSI